MKTQYKVLITIMAIFLLFIGIFIYFNNLNNTMIVLSPNFSIKYEGKKWKKDDIDKKTNYNIYVDGNYRGIGGLILDDGVISFENEILQNFIATSSEKTKIIKYEEKIIEQKEYQEILKKLKITKYHELSIAKKIEIDYDNDNQNETIYILSNLFVDPFMEDIDDEKFSIAYTVDDNDMNIIYKKHFTSDINGCLLNINGIIDVNNDNKYELITTCSYFDQKGRKAQIYELIKNKYKLIKEI